MVNLRLRLADARDAERVAGCVQRAYARYADRLPRPPKPVLVDYHVAVAHGGTWLLDLDGQCVGVLVLEEQPGGLLIENVAVAPEHQGHGFGRQLLDFAEREALRRGFSEVRLYTHALMTENRAIYARRGYLEYERREVDGRDTVFMRKGLGA